MIWYVPYHTLNQPETAISRDKGWYVLKIPISYVVNFDVLNTFYSVIFYEEDSLHSCHELSFVIVYFMNMIANFATYFWRFYYAKRQELSTATFVA